MRQAGYAGIVLDVDGCQWLRKCMQALMKFSLAAQRQTAVRARRDTASIPAPLIEAFACVC
jgi:hypothetical protein